MLNTVNFNPRRILLDPTSVCNLRCVQCHNATGLDPIYHIDMKRVDELVEMSKSEPGMLVSLTGKGDILCHPQWKEMLRRLDTCDNLTSMFYTNALLLKDSDIDFCWNLKNLKVMHVSIDAANAESYRNIRGGDFNKLKKILSALGFHPKAKALRMSMTVMKENVNQMKDFVDLAVEVGFHAVSFQAIFNRPYTPIKTPKGFVFDNSQVLLAPEIEDRVVEAAEYGKKKHLFVDTEQLGYMKDKHPIMFWHKFFFDTWLKKAMDITSGEREEDEKSEIRSLLKARPACLRPWTELSHIDEGWRVCCMQFHDSVLGGKDATLQEAWNSPQMQRIRDELLNHKCPPECDPVHCEIAAKLDTKITDKRYHRKF